MSSYRIWYGLLKTWWGVLFMASNYVPDIEPKKRRCS